MSLSDRPWTQFAIEAEVERFGASRICAEYNRLCREVERLRAQAPEPQGETVEQQEARHNEERRRLKRQSWEMAERDEPKKDPEGR